MNYSKRQADAKTQSEGLTLEQKYAALTSNIKDKYQNIMVKTKDKQNYINYNVNMNRKMMMVHISTIKNKAKEPQKDYESLNQKILSIQTGEASAHLRQERYQGEAESKLANF